MNLLEKSKTKSAKTDLKKEEIIRVASHLFSEKGFRETSLEEIGGKVNLHKTSLFYYFKNKEGILMAIMDTFIIDHLNILEEIINDTKLSGADKFKLALEKHFTLACDFGDHINIYLNEIKSLSPENRKKYYYKRKQYELLFENIIWEVQTDKKSPLFEGLDSKIVTLAILGMCNWIIKWYNDSGPLKPNEIFQIFYSILTKTKITDSSVD